MEKLQINCPPDTYLMIQNNEKYREEVTNQILRGDNTTYSEIIFVPNDEIDSQKKSWLEAPTKLLLSLFDELRPKVGKTASVKTKSKMWEIISEKMALNGYKFTPTQIENRYRTLERQYKKTNLHNKQTGRNKESCPFQSELDQVLGQKRGINPDFILDSSDAEGTKRSGLSHQNSDNDIISKDDDDDVSSIPPKKRVCPQERNKKIDQMIEDRKNYQDKVLYFLKKSDERSQRKEERAAKKDEIQRKNWNSWKL